MPCRRFIPLFCVILLFTSPASARIGLGSVGVDDATTLWPGVWELKTSIEAGAAYKLDGAKLDAIKVPVSLRYGWQERVEIGFGVPFMFQNSQTAKYDGAGLSDAYAAIKYQMTQNEGVTPASSTELRLGYSGDQIVGSDAFSVAINYALTKMFSNGRSAGHLNLGYTIYTANRDDVFGWGIGYERKLRDTLRWTAGVNSGMQVLPGVKNDIMAELGIAGEVNPSLEYMFAGGVGVTKESPDWQIRMGVTKEFGRNAGEATVYRATEWNRPPAPSPIEKVHLGEDAARTGDLTLAIAYYREALAGDSGLSSAWNNMGIALYRLGRTRDALEAYENAAKLEPANADIFFNMGLAHYKLGEISSARRAFAAALKINPQHTLARSNLMSLEGRTGAP
jgi:tetratricopeptide (TPR) repeat protein